MAALHSPPPPQPLSCSTSSTSICININVAPNCAQCLPTFLWDSIKISVCLSGLRLYLPLTRYMFFSLSLSTLLSSADCVASLFSSWASEQPSFLFLHRVKFLRNMLLRRLQHLLADIDWLSRLAINAKLAAKPKRCHPPKPRRSRQPIRGAWQQTPNKKKTVAKRAETKRNQCQVDTLDPTRFTGLINDRGRAFYKL